MIKNDEDLDFKGVLSLFRDNQYGRFTEDARRIAQLGKRQLIKELVDIIEELANERVRNVSWDKD